MYYAVYNPYGSNALNHNGKRANQLLIFKSHEDRLIALDRWKGNLVRVTSRDLRIRRLLRLPREVRVPASEVFVSVSAAVDLSIYECIAFHDRCGR